MPCRVKEWTYEGFGIDFISAFVSMWAVDGLSAMLVMPLVFIGILVLSYVSFDKLHKVKG